MFRYEDLNEKHEILCSSDTELREKLRTLELSSSSQTSDLKNLKELCNILGGEKKDFDMKLELALSRKNMENKVRYSTP